jgi:hypothetical protein
MRIGVFPSSDITKEQAPFRGAFALHGILLYFSNVKSFPCDEVYAVSGVRV